MADFAIVGSGPNSASPHHAASERVIRAGEVISVMTLIGEPAKMLEEKLLNPVDQSQRAITSWERYTSPCCSRSVRGAVWKPASPFRSKSRRSSSLNVTEFLPFGGARDAPPATLAPRLSVSRVCRRLAERYPVPLAAVRARRGEIWGAGGVRDIAARHGATNRRPFKIPGEFCAAVCAVQDLGRDGGHQDGS